MLRREGEETQETPDSQSLRVRSRRGARGPGITVPIEDIIPVETIDPWDDIPGEEPQEGPVSESAGEEITEAIEEGPVPDDVTEEMPWPVPEASVSAEDTPADTIDPGDGIPPDTEPVSEEPQSYNPSPTNPRG